MAEAVENSTAQMTASDLNAIAVYLKDLPASRGNGGGATGVEAQLRSGRSLYDINCAACHGRDGKGSVLFPALAGNANVRQVRADTVVRMVLAGGQAVATPKAPTGPGMPSLGWKLSNESGGGHSHLCAQQLGQSGARRCRRRRWAASVRSCTQAVSIVRYSASNRACQARRVEQRRGAARRRQLLLAERQAAPDRAPAPTPGLHSRPSFRQ